MYTRVEQRNKAHSLIDNKTFEKMKKTKEIENVREYITNEHEEWGLKFFSKDEIEKTATVFGIPFVWVHGRPALDLRIISRKVDTRNHAFLVQKTGDKPRKASTMLQVARAVKKGLLSQNETYTDGRINTKENEPYMNLSNRQY